MKRFGSIAGMAIAAGVFAATMVGAQSTKRFVLTPYVGVYAPTTNLMKDVDGSARHKAATTLGLNASYWLSDRVAIEVGGAYAFSDTKFSNGVSDDAGSDLSTTEGAHVMFGSVKAMLGLLPADSRMSLRLGFGPAIISRGGSAYKVDEGKIVGLTDVGGAISLCSKIPITNVVAVRVRAEDFIYQAKLSYRDNTSALDNVDFDKKMQSDLVFSAGLQIAFFR